MKALTKVSALGSKIGFTLKKYSPEILVATGVVGTVVTTVLACKATLKINDILTDTKETVDKIHEAENSEQFKDEYTAEDAKKDLTITYTKTAVQIAKIYAPAVAVGIFSVTSILAGTNILRKRNVALSAAFTTVSEGFSEYRKRVVEKFGEDIDKELKYGIKAEKIEKTVTDENGKEKKVKETVGVSELSEYSPYAVYFDHTTSSYYENNDIHNNFFLNCQENYANDLLKARKHKNETLYEVWEGLGVLDSLTEDQIATAMVVGWRYIPDNPDGDNKITFNRYSTYRKLPTGEIIPTIIIDPNVDGNIYKKLKK